MFREEMTALRDKLYLAGDRLITSGLLVIAHLGGSPTRRCGVA
jgi:hypothetical protein